MGLHVERVGDVAVVEPSGMLKGGKETDDLENGLRKLINDQQGKIVLDLGKTTHMSSPAIGVLASIHTSAVNRGLRLHVCNIERRIDHTLTIVKLVRVLNVFNTRDDAIAAFDA